MLSLLLALLGTPGPGLLPSCPLQARTYVSPDGQWSVHVEPTLPFGAGEGRYTLRHDGAELWTLAKPWTLQQADVTDSGTFAGHAFTAGSRRWAPYDRVVAIVDAQGLTLLDERLGRPSSTGPCSEPPEIVLGCFVQHGAERLVVRLLDPREPEPRRERWARYALESGEHLGTAQVEQLVEMPPGCDRVLDVVPVTDTPLAAVRFGSRFGEQLGVLVLVDEAWRTVWTLAPPAWRTLAAECVPGAHVASANPLPCDEPRLVRYGLPGADLVVELQALEDRHVPGFWRVLARASAASGSARGEHAPAPASTHTELVLVSEKPLRVEQEAAVDASAACECAIGPDGRLYVAHADGSVTVHAEDGALLHRCVAPEGAALAPWAPPRPGAGGVVHLAVRGARSAFTHLTFDATGAVVGTQRQRNSVTRFLPESELRWVEHLSQLVLESSTGSSLLTLARTPEGQFFRQIVSWDVGPTGSIALVEGPCCEVHPRIERLHLYDGYGTGLRSVDLGSFGQHEVVEARRWSVLAPFGPRLLLVRRVDGAVFEAEVEALMPGAAEAPGDGSELWVLGKTHAEAPRLVLRRYRLPG